MLKFITDVQNDEPDILTPVKHNDLLITDLDGVQMLIIPAPEGGWSDELLWAASDRYIAKTANGAEAYLGEQWVGSTEV
jgi:hypothetical protein